MDGSHSGPVWSRGCQMSGLKIQLGSQGCSGGPDEDPRAGHGMAGTEQDVLERLRAAVGPWETGDVTRAPGELGWRVWKSLQPGKLRHGGAQGQRKVLKSCEHLLGWALCSPRNHPCGEHRGLGGLSSGRGTALGSQRSRSWAGAEGMDGSLWEGEPCPIEG